MGTAALPTGNTPTFLQEASDGRDWYQTWSHLTTSTVATSHQRHSIPPTNLIACYADDARIAVNAELSAGNGVYAAGSVAKYPNPWTGNADTAGVGAHDATQAGVVAAHNMARDYSLRTGGGQQQQRFAGLLLGGKNHPTILSGDAAFLKHPIPIWRSDQMNSLNCNDNALQGAGIHALCVGSCDSERFSTQAFWWTNQSKRLRQIFDENGKNGGGRVTKASTRKDHPANVRPVYGRGIVYYMDQDAGQIQGIMMWGLPFTTNNKKKKTEEGEGEGNYHDSKLNTELIQHMEEIIQTNGGFTNLGMESELERVRFVQYLTEQSRELVADSIEPFVSRKVEPDDLPRPLIRYTEVRPARIRRVRVLNKSNEAQGHGFLGEDLFTRCNDRVTEVPPAPLPNFDSLREVSDSDAEARLLQSRDVSREERTAIHRSRTQAMQDWAVWEWYQRRWEENEDLARPPKEELLWLRRGDENRGVSSRDRFNEAYLKAIFPDGR